MSHEKVQKQLFWDECDYVVSVAQHKDGSSEVATVARELKKAGFYVAATNADSSKQVLFLVRLTPKALARAAMTFQTRDIEAGVLTPPVSLDGEDLTPAFRDRMAYESLQAAGLTPDRSKAIEAVWPYGHSGIDNRLFKKASQTLKQDVSFVRNHYGDEIAMYFAFAGYTARMVLVPAVLGVLGELVLGPYSGVIGALNVAWAICYAFGWRYRQALYANEWNTHNIETVVTRRQDFKGTTPQTRQFRSLFFVPLAILLCAVYVAGVVFGLGCEVFLTQMYDGPYKKILALAPTAGYIVLAQIFRLVYDKIVDFYLTFEDYPSEEEEQGHRAQRQYWATFFLNYTPILLSAYLYLPFGHLIAYNFGTISSSVAGYNLTVVPQFELNTERLKTQTVYYAITNQLVGFATDVILPLVKVFLAKRKIKQGPTARAQLEAAVPTYSVDGDYLIIITLLGYALLTAPVWPLAPVAVAFGICIRQVASSVKLAYEFRRPTPRRVASIGCWNSNILFLAGLASVTVPTITAMYQTQKAWSANSSLVAVTPIAVLTLGFVCENLFLLASKTIESSFKVLVEAPSKLLPGVQSGTPPRATASDIEWENHDLEDDIRALQT